MGMPSFGKVRMAICAACLIGAAVQGAMLVVSIPGHNAIMEQAARIAEVEEQTGADAESEQVDLFTMTREGREMEQAMQDVSAMANEGKVKPSYTGGMKDTFKSTGLRAGDVMFASNWDFMTMFPSDEHERTAVWLASDDDGNIVGVAKARWTFDGGGKFSDFEVLVSDGSEIKAPEGKDTGEPSPSASSASASAVSASASASATSAGAEPSQSSASADDTVDGKSAGAGEVDGDAS